MNRSQDVPMHPEGCMSPIGVIQQNPFHGFHGDSFISPKPQESWLVAWHSQRPGRNAPLATRSSWAQNDVTKVDLDNEILPRHGTMQVAQHPKPWTTTENSSPVLAWLGSNILYQSQEPTSAHAAGDWDILFCGLDASIQTRFGRNVKLIDSWSIWYLS